MSAAPEENPQISQLLKKTLVTALVAGGTFILTTVLIKDPNDLWQWTVTITVGTATLIVQYLVDFGDRLEAMEGTQEKRIREMRDSLAEHHAQMRRAVDESFAKINDATELFSQVDRSVLRSDGVTVSPR
jgi:hypothetical protein